MLVSNGTCEADWPRLAELHAHLFDEGFAGLSLELGLPAEALDYLASHTTYSTTNAVSPPVLFSLSVRAITMMTPALSPVEMNILVPLRTYSSPSLTADMLIAETSLPAFGSVRA